MSNNHGKVIFLQPKSDTLFRIKRNNFNYFKSLFYASLSFNILLIAIIIGLKL
jgi:hypothetical protein